MREHLHHTSGFRVTVTVFIVVILFLLALLQNYALFELPKAYNDGYDQCKVEYKIYMDTLKAEGMLSPAMPKPAMNGSGQP